MQKVTREKAHRLKLESYYVYRKWETSLDVFSLRQSCLQMSFFFFQKQVSNLLQEVYFIQVTFENSLKYYIYTRSCGYPKNEYTPDSSKKVLRQTKKKFFWYLMSTFQQYPSTLNSILQALKFNKKKFKARKLNVKQFIWRSPFNWKPKHIPRFSDAK